MNTNDKYKLAQEAITRFVKAEKLRSYWTGQADYKEAMGYTIGDEIKNRIIEADQQCVALDEDLRMTLRELIGD